MRTEEVRIAQHNGDVMLIPRTWLADAMGANPHHLALTMWWIGFGLTCGAGIGIILILTIQGIIKAATHG
ncbi:hypothetical protein MHZ93_18045 [Roseomonas sp. ACRSG]|nr:hypothetical protein [Roseomonas sp. ACRSG]